MADGPHGAGRPFLVSVIGAARATHREYELANALGGALARLGAVVVCGGHGGVMEAVSKGAAEAGGLVVGFLKGEDAATANPWVGLPIPTGLGDARNVLVARTGEAVVAIGGSWGTLSEIALARKAGRAVGLLGAPPADGLDLPDLEDPVSAANWAVEKAREHRGETYPGPSGSSRRAR